jgi:glycogen synthase
MQFRRCKGGRDCRGYEIRRQLGLPPESILIGAVGRLWPQKGIKNCMWGLGLGRVGSR